MARIVYPTTGALTEQEIMEIAKQNDGPGSGFDADRLDDSSIEDFVTKAEFASFIDQLGNEVPVLISRSYITPDATYSSFTASVPTNIYMKYNYNELKTDWEISKTIDFNETDIVASAYDREMPDAATWTPGALPVNTRYYIRVRWKYRHHLSHWSFPLGYNLGNPTYVVEPTISIPGAPNSISTGPEIETTPFDSEGNTGPHVATDWIIEDAFNNTVWESLGNINNLTKIILPVGTLETNTKYVIKARHITNTHVSNFGKIVATTSPFTYNNIFRSISALPVGLRLTSNSQLNNNVMLVTGGALSDFTITSNVYKYDTDGNNGNGAITTGPNMINPRYRHASSLLLDGRVFVTGGINNSGNNLSSTEFFTNEYGGNPDEWTSGTTMAKPRHGHCQVTLSDGSVLITGGVTDTTTASDEVILFIPTPGSTTGTWLSLPSMSQGRRNHGMSVLGNGTVLVTGGVSANNIVLSSCEIFDPSANNGSGEWKTIDPLASGRESHGQSQLTDGSALLTGGVGNGGLYQTNSLIYNPNLNLGYGGWVIINGLNTPRKWHSQATNGGGQPVIIAGFASNNNLTSCELFS
jgi:hypothetical protein